MAMLILGGSTLTLKVMLQGSLLAMLILGGPMDTDFECDVGGITSGNDDPGGLTNPDFESDVGGITSGNADPGGGGVN